MVTTPSESGLPEFPVTAADPGTPVAAPPLQVRVSFWILIVSAALRFLIAVLLVVSWNRLIDNALAQIPVGTTPAQLRSEMHTYLIANLALDLVFGGLYVLFAYMVRAGRNWARLTITAIVVVFGLYDLLEGSDLITVASVLVELVAIGLLYVPASREYFSTMKAAAGRRFQP